ncbi:hypothetical protein C8F04DRAFT_983229 [Mycena alexandri]|uniref:Uncharacterized protein n=1 Tax=Mycena alexandri TaxID=1745969 RepID=A0AAD6RVJ8_9AGAR|nr:hypothetical protein C8F04DRAFT_983229 [Mycena alexandri]
MTRRSRSFPESLLLLLTPQTSLSNSSDINSRFALPSRSPSTRLRFFSHGQLYVAFSQATSSRQIRVLLPDTSQASETTNVVYPEVLLSATQILCRISLTVTFAGPLCTVVRSGRLKTDVNTYAVRALVVIHRLDVPIMDGSPPQPEISTTYFALPPIP